MKFTRKRQIFIVAATMLMLVPSLSAMSSYACASEGGIFTSLGSDIEPSAVLDCVKGKGSPEAVQAAIKAIEPSRRAAAVCKIDRATGWTAVMYAADRNDLATVDVLMEDLNSYEQSIAVSHKDDAKLASITLAVKRKYAAMVRKLLGYVGDERQKFFAALEKDDKGQTPVMWAAYEGADAALKELLESLTHEHRVRVIRYTCPAGRDAQFWARNPKGYRSSEVMNMLSRYLEAPVAPAVSAAAAEGGAAEAPLRPDACAGAGAAGPK